MLNYYIVKVGTFEIQTAGWSIAGQGQVPTYLGTYGGTKVLCVMSGARPPKPDFSPVRGGGYEPGFVQSQEKQHPDCDQLFYSVPKRQSCSKFTTTLDDTATYRPTHRFNASSRPVGVWVS